MGNTSQTAGVVPYMVEGGLFDDHTILFVKKYV
jgi:hypothetical protein